MIYVNDAQVMGKYLRVEISQNRRHHTLYARKGALQFRRRRNFMLV